MRGIKFWKGEWVYNIDMSVSSLHGCLYITDGNNIIMVEIFPVLKECF